VLSLQETAETRTIYTADRALQEFFSTHPPPGCFTCGIYRHKNDFHIVFILIWEKTFSEKGEECQPQLRSRQLRSGTCNSALILTARVLCVSGRLSDTAPGQMPLG
jgi:hypothetical protein